MFMPKSRTFMIINNNQLNVSLQMVNGSFYEGKWMNGMPHGEGKYILENG